MKIKRILNNKFAYLLIGAFVGFLFNYFLNIKSLERQNYYANNSEKRSFVLELCELMQERIYNAEVFFWSVRDHDQPQTILANWDKYRDITRKWNNKLINTYIKLQLLFPGDKYYVKFIDLNERVSYRDFLAGIQDEFITIHGDLIRFKKITNNNEVPDKEQLTIVQKKIEKLHVIIANYLQDLAGALRK